MRGPETQAQRPISANEDMYLDILNEFWNSD